MAQGDITIRIKQGGDGTGETVISDKTGTILKDYADIPNAKAKNTIALVVAKSAYEYTKQVVIDSAEYAINRQFQLTDDYIGKRNLSICLNILNRGIQLGSSIATGAMIGGVPGAIVAGVGNLAVQGVGVFKALDQQNIKIAQLNEQLSFTRERSGYSLTDGSVGRNM